MERAGRSGRAATETRRTKVDDAARTHMRELAADGWSLRRIAREFDVSHETVRTVLRESEAVSTAEKAPQKKACNSSSVSSVSSEIA